jgi:uncharacterized protein (DUF1330 family)
MTNYLVYICQAVRDRTGLERYWRDAPAAYPKSDVDVLAGYGPCEVLDADQEERVERVVIAEFPPFEQTVAWFNGDAYVQTRKDRTNNNDYLGIVVESGIAPASQRSADKPVYVVFVCREILDQGELNIYWQRVNETLAACRPSSNGCRRLELLGQQRHGKFFDRCGSASRSILRSRRAQLAPTSSSTLPPRSTWATASLMADKG